MFAGLAFYASEKDLIGLYYGHQGSEERLLNLERDIAELEVEKKQLERKISGLDTDPVLIEMAIRRNTGHVRKGETVYRVEIPATE
jgi:cell division protein FtsB